MLKTRVLTALVLIPSFLAALFLLPAVHWALLALAVTTVALWEWGRMAGFSPSACVGYALAAATAGTMAFFGPGEETFRFVTLTGLLLSAVFWILAAPVWLLRRHQFSHSFPMALLGWLVVLPFWLALVGLRQIDPWLLLAVMAAVWIADSAAYFFGKRFGKRKLAPLVSPGKTWEGVWGAWLAVTLYGLVLCRLFQFDYWLLVGLWAITVLSIMGDLLESLVKRQAGLKDSGSLLPGHGGVLDRIDGLTSTLPLAAFFVYFPLYFDILPKWQ